VFFKGEVAELFFGGEEDDFKFGFGLLDGHRSILEFLKKAFVSLSYDKFQFLSHEFFSRSRDKKVRVFQEEALLSC